MTTDATSENDHDDNHPVLFTDGNVCVYQGAGINSELTAALNNPARTNTYTSAHEKYISALTALKDADWAISHWDTWMHPISFENVLLLLQEHDLHKNHTQPKKEK